MGGILEKGSVHLDATDDGGPEPEHPKELIAGPLLDQELLRHIRRAVQHGCGKAEQVSLQHIHA